MARENKADPNTAAVAAEDASMRAAAAAHNKTNNRNDQGYTDRVAPLMAETAAKITKDRGPKHTRS